MLDFPSMRRAPWLLVPLLFSTVAQAGRVVPMLPQVKPAGAVTELRERFQDAVTRGLSPDPDVVPPQEVRRALGASAELLECAGGPCVGRVATVLRAEKVVVTEVEQTGKNYIIRVHVFDPNGQEVGAATEERCDICSVREADAATQKAASRAMPLVTKPIAPPAPPPVAAQEGPDSPKLASAREPDRPPPKPQVGDGEPPPPSTPPAPPPSAGKEQASKFPYRPLAYGAFAVAGASLITTIVFSVYAGREGNPTCDKPNPKTACPDIYKGNTGPAVAFGVITAVAAVGGAVLLYLDHRNKQRLHVAALPTPGGFAAAAGFDF